MIAGRWQPTLLPLAEAGIVLDLERRVYGDVEVADRGYYDWLYRANPGGEAMIWYAATGDPAAPSAGQYVVVPMRVALGDETVRAGLALNVVTHPAYRREGVFAALGSRAFEEGGRRGLAFTFALPNPNSTPGFLQSLGFRDFGRVPLLVVPLDARRLAGAGGLLRRAAVAVGGGVAVHIATARRARVRPAATVEEVAADWRGWDELWAAVRGKYPLMVVRDRAFLAWRFGACPTRAYRLYVARRAGAVVGFTVTRLATLLGLRAGLVVDLVVVPGMAGADAGAALLTHGLAEFGAAGAALAAALMPPHAEEYRCLRGVGFLRCPRALEPQPFRVVLREHGETPHHAPAFASWLLTMGDYDAV